MTHPDITMIKSKIEYIEDLQKKIYFCLEDCEAQLKEIAKQYAVASFMTTETGKGYDV